MTENVSDSHGITFFGMLQVLFIGLKLTGHIEWSWWWVLSPLWIPIVLVLLAAILMGLFYMTRN